MKRILLMLLILATVLSCFSACKKDTPTQDPTSIGDESDILGSAPKLDLQAETKKILISPNFQIFAEEDKLDIIDHTKYVIGAYIEDRLNCVLEHVLTDGPNNTLAYIDRNHLSGGGMFDLVVPHSTEGVAGTLSGGYAVDLLTMNNLSLDEAWYNQSFVDGFKINGKLYSVVSDVGCQGRGGVGLVYNKKLYDSLNCYEDDLYDIVKDGDWTLDYFYAAVKKYQPSRENLEPDDGPYCFVYHKGSCEAGFLYAIGEKFAIRDANDKYVFGYNKTNINNAASVLYSLLWESSNVYVKCKSNGQPYYYSEWDTSPILLKFKEGNCLFCTYDIGGLYSYLLDTEFHVGYLPLPKADSYQKNYATITPGLGLMIPIAGTNAEEAAAIIECFARGYHVKMLPEYFNRILAGRASEEAEDYEMLQLIYNSAVYDIGYAMGNTQSKQVFKITVADGKQNTCDALFKANEYIYQAIIDKINALGKSTS